MPAQQLRVGMAAPARRIRIAFGPRTGVDYTSATITNMVCNCTVRSTGEVFALSGTWTAVNVTPTSFAMQFDPVGTEFNRPGLPGALKISGSITVNSIVYPFDTIVTQVIPL
jgi:hypothetical protein